MKKKKIIKCKYLLLIIIGMILVTIGSSFLIYKNYKINKEKQLVIQIKSHYNNYVITNKNAKIYKKSKNKYIKYGKISKDISLQLEKINIKKSSQTYFKVNNQDYYLYYDDVEKIDKIEKTNINNNYLIFNKNVKTKDKTKFNNGEKYIEVDKSFELPIQYMDDNNYYVTYLNDLYSINKSNSIELIDITNTEEKEAEYISILDYSNLNIDKLKEQLEYLKSNGYYTIGINTYKEWLKSNIRLKEKAILLTYDNENNEILSNINNYGFEIIFNKDLDVKFINNNATTTKDNKIDNLNRYNVKDSTSLDDFKKMCNGQKVEETIVKQNNDVSIINQLPNLNDNATKIAVINYHFFYDPTLNESCNEGICLDVKKFKEQLQYLKDNNYKTLKMEEFKSWMYGEIELPARSVLLTIDDGAMGTGAHNGNKLIPILEEYDMYATLFLIAGWWDKSNYVSDHLDVESHTFDMHTGNLCSNQPRGAQMLCSTKEQVLNDLKKSIEILGTNTAFCFPFYAYNDSTIESVKEVGFKLAFVGGNVKATRNSNKYMIPRYPVYNSTSLNQFINMVN